MKKPGTILKKGPILNVARPVAQTLTEIQFDELGRLVSREIGIQMPLGKRIFLQNRLQARLRDLSLKSFDDYLKFLSDPGRREGEIAHFIDSVVTNKTDFFREPEHFRLLRDRLLVEIVKKNSGRLPRIWSAAVSTGQEAWSLAILLEEWRREHQTTGEYQILGTDISQRALETARTAVYPEREIQQLAPEMKIKYFRRHREKPLARVAPFLRERVQFRRENIKDMRPGEEGRFDIIFCRNVLIYFHRDEYADMGRRLLTRLKPGGYIFIGHSESFNKTGLPLKYIKPSVYQKTGK